MQEEAFVLFVRKNAIQVLIPKYGLEGTIFLDKNSKHSLAFNEEVISILLCLLVMMMMMMMTMKMMKKKKNNIKNN